MLKRKKKDGVMRTTLCIITLLLAPLAAQAALVDDFEGYTPGVIPAPWVITHGTPTVGQEAGGNKYLESYGSYRSLAGASISDSDTETTVFYRIFKRAENSPDCSVGWSDFTDPSGMWEDFEAYVVVLGNTLRARDGGDNTTLMTISDDTWYNIWLVINNSAQTYDVYVTTGTADATIGDREANDFDFRTDNGDSPADLVTFKVYGRSADGPVRVDDIHITGGLDLSIPVDMPVPVIVSDPEDVTTTQAQTAVFETVFTSESTPSAVWYKAADPDDIYMDPAESNIDVELTYDAPSEQYTSTLTVTNLTASDTGQYYCQVINTAGSRNSDPAELLVYGPVAHWTLNQDRYTGGYYLEEMAGLNAAVTGTPTFVTGADGAANGAAVISAANGWALCPVFDPVQQSGQMTVSFWVNWAESPPTQEDLLAESTDDETLVMTNGLTADGQWQHICTVFDGTTGKLYVDGMLQDEGDWQLPAETEAAVNIGVDSNGLNAFNGAMDDVRLYNYAFTEYDVADLRYSLSGQGTCIPGYADQYDVTGPAGVPDCRVDIYDLTAAADDFLQNGSPYDLTGPAGTPDGTVDLYEFADLASSWLSCGLYPACN
jgi:hypothetical protein